MRLHNFISWLYGGVWIGLLFIGLLAVFSSAGYGDLHSLIASAILFWVFQWLLTLPHELGHALAARMLGFANVRIQLGYGLPIFQADFLGFSWIFCRVPFGGFTLLGGNPNYTPAKGILVTLAGPTVSICAMLIVWYAFFSFESLPNLNTISGVFFWANAFVLAQTLIPYRYQSGSEQLPNDGLLVLQALFSRDSRFWIAFAKIRASFGKSLQILAIVLMSFSTILLALLAFFSFTYMFKRDPGPFPILLGVFLAVLSVILGRLTHRYIREPFRVDSPPQGDHLFNLGLQEMAELSAASSDPAWKTLKDKEDPSKIHQFVIDQFVPKYPNDLWLRYARSSYLIHDRKFDEALSLLEIDDSNVSWNIRFILAAVRLHCLIPLDRTQEAISIVEKWLVNDSPKMHKLQIIDSFVSLHFYNEKLQKLDLLEDWINRGLQIDPNDIHLKATLGGIYVEQGRIDDAVPLLLQRIESAPHHDESAFSLFYLSQIHAAQNNLVKAQDVLDVALSVGNESWLISRATTFARKYHLKIPVHVRSL